MFKDSTVSPDNEAELFLIPGTPSLSVFKFVPDRNAWKRSRIGAGEERTEGLTLSHWVSPRSRPWPLDQPLFPSRPPEPREMHLLVKPLSGLWHLQQPELTKPAALAPFWGCGV